MIVSKPAVHFAPYKESSPPVFPGLQNIKTSAWRQVLTQEDRPRPTPSQICTVEILVLCVNNLHCTPAGDRLYFNEGEDRDDHGPPVQFTSTTAPRPAAGEYNEGDISDREYNLYQEDQNGNDRSEVGKRTKQRESRAARAERFAAS